MRRGRPGAVGAGGQSAVGLCNFWFVFLTSVTHPPKSPWWLGGLALSEATSKTSRGVLEGNIKYLCGAKIRASWRGAESIRHRPELAPRSS